MAERDSLIAAPDVPAWDRPVSVIGVRKQSNHPVACRCEACGPMYALFLSEYEAIRLLDALERRDGRDTGDWHGQLRQKLTSAIGRERIESVASYFGVKIGG